MWQNDGTCIQRVHKYAKIIIIQNWEARMEGFTPVCSQNLRIFQAFMRFCRGLGVGADPGNQNIE